MWFYYTGSIGCWWTADEIDSSKAYERLMYFDNDRLDDFFASKDEGRSVRCVAD